MTPTFLVPGDLKGYQVIVKETWGKKGSAHRESWLGGDTSLYHNWEPVGFDPRERGYLQLTSRTSRSGSKSWVSWLKPDSGILGLLAWASYTEKSLAVFENPLSIIAKEGTGRFLIGKGGETIKKISRHLGIAGFVKISEARIAGGTRVVVHTRKENPRLVVVHLDGTTNFTCFWDFEGKFFAFEVPASFYEVGAPELKDANTPVSVLKPEDIDDLGNGRQPAPRIGWMDQVLASPEQIQKAWEVAQTLPGYREAREALKAGEKFYPIPVLR